VPAPTLIISDLHLDASRPDITDQFLQFLRTDARRAQALYILGDLFESWIGDDDPDADKIRIQQALRELTATGIPCYIMHGNRDFLIGKRFCKATGCKLLDDGVIVTLNGQRAVLMHGDTLCTDDRDYQRLRRIVRNPLVKLVFRIMSLKQRQKLAAKIREGSKAHIENSMAQIMDVNAAAVTQAFKNHGVDLLIHGHTHRPAIHSLSVDSRPATRIVLGDWYTQGSVLRFDERGYDLSTLVRA
jgi:UDP-2,3-diacylglucosamine hydrolase